MRAITVSDSSTVKEFHRVPDIIYAQTDNYIPHLRQDIDRLFDKSKNRLLEKGEAVRWVFYDDQGDLVGRVAAFINPKTAHATSLATGGMGFFESIDDQSTANFIFDTAKAWLEKRGMEAMDGPINFGERNQFWGCLTENFTDPNSYGMNFNPPYYPALFENYGFRTYFKQFQFMRDVFEPVQEVFVRKVKLLEERSNVKATNMVGVSTEKLTADFLTVYNGAWGGHEGFKPMNAATAASIVKKLKPVLDKRIVFFAYHNDEPIGFFINIPELNDIFKHVNGNLNLWGKLKFLYHKWKGTPRTMVGIIFGVVREWHGKGVEGAMIYAAGEYLRDKDIYDRIVMTWVGDFNPKMLRVIENLGAQPYREMKTYRYLFDRDAPFERHPILE